MSARRPVALAVSGLLACGGDAPPPADVAIRGVTVLSPADGSRAEDRTVLVHGDSIVAVVSRAEGDAPEGVVAIDGTGRFLIPGLWDFHTHLSLSDPSAAPLLVTQGVTGARDVGGYLERLDSLRARIRSGEIPGPRILRAGPTLNGQSFAPFQRVIDSPEAARAAVAELDARGVDFLKTHNQTGREPYFALLRAAEEAGLEVVGHVPVTVSPMEACEAGQASVEHIVTIFEGTYMAGFDSEIEASRGIGEWLDEDASALIECFAHEGTMFVPTLYTYLFRAHRAAMYDDPPEGWEYLTAETLAAYRESELTETDRNPQVIALRESLVRVGQTLTRRMYEAGVAIGAGTDMGPPGLVPGFALHRELELLVEAGLPAHAAIWAAARGPGEGAGAHPLTGRIEAGAPADLVILSEDPFAMIGAVRSIEAVVLRGEVLERVELDRILEVLAGR